MGFLSILSRNAMVYTPFSGLFHILLVAQKQEENV